MTDYELSDLVLKCAFRVHAKLGSGLLEKAYLVCLAHELDKEALHFEVEKSLPIIYDGFKLDHAFRMDIVVEDRLVLELKVVDAISENHKAQLLTYLKFSKIKYGLILNFKEKSLKDGIKRMAL